MHISSDSLDVAGLVFLPYHIVYSICGIIMFIAFFASEQYNTMNYHTTAFLIVSLLHILIGTLSFADLCLHHDVKWAKYVLFSVLTILVTAYSIYVCAMFLPMDGYSLCDLHNISNALCGVNYLHMILWFLSIVSFVCVTMCMIGSMTGFHPNF